MVEVFKKLKMTFDQLGFVRVPREDWVVPSKGKLEDESPAGLYPTIIVPEHHLHKRMFLMDYEIYEKMWEEIFRVHQGV